MIFVAHSLGGNLVKSVRSILNGVRNSPLILLRLWFIPPRILKRILLFTTMVYFSRQLASSR